MPSFRPCSVADPAGWVADSLWRTYHSFGRMGAAVTSVLPSGFEAFLRVLHPFAGPFDGQDRPELACGELAARLGRQLRPLAPVDQLIEGLDETALERLDVILPTPGALPTTIAHSIVDVLGRHTAMPKVCYFAVWEGYGGLHPRQGFGAAFQIPSRRMYLYAAPIAAATERFDCESFPSAYPPNIWWAADQAWCVVTEIDYRCTYIGCDGTAARELLTHPKLDAFQVQPHDIPHG